MVNHRPSVRHLKRVDPVLARVIEQVGPCRIELRTDGTHYNALTRAIGYMRDLSLKVTTGDLPLDAVEHMADDDLIAHLVQVKGIGRWTAQMFLMFRLGRPDVLPELDLGIQNAIRKAYRMRKRPTPKQVKRIGAKWSPHSSVASWYLWRSLENGDGQLGAE
jgi:DNA-3-methyladenine glycosylase II